MRAIVCEICGSKELIKKDDLFECQNCGMNYKLEDVKKMFVDGTVNVTGSVKLDKTEDFKHYLKLSEENYEGNNGELAHKYANKALEIDSTNPEAWLKKLQSLVHLITLEDVMYDETITAANNIITYSSDENSSEFENDVYFTFSLILIRVSVLLQHEFSNKYEIIAYYNRMLRLNSHQYNPQKMATLETLKHEIYTIFALTLSANESVSKLIDQIDPKIVSENISLTFSLQKLVESYGNVLVEIDKRLNSYGATRNDMRELVEPFSKTKSQVERKIIAATNIIKEKEEKEKAVRVEKYWEEHPEEKERLEKEINEYNKKITEYETEIKNLSIKVELTNLRKKIKEEERLAGKISFFRFKDKKEASLKIETLNNKLKEMSAESRKQEDSINRKINELKKLISNNRTALTRDR